MSINPISAARRQFRVPTNPVSQKTSYLTRVRSPVFYRGSRSDSRRGTQHPTLFHITCVEKAADRRRVGQVSSDTQHNIQVGIRHSSGRDR